MKLFTTSPAKNDKTTGTYYEILFNNHFGIIVQNPFFRTAAMVVFLRGANIYLSLSWLHNKIKRPHHCLLPKQLFVTNICLYLPQQIILTNIEMLTDSNIKQFLFCVSPVCVLCQYCGSPAYHQFIRTHLRDPGPTHS